MWCQVSAKAKGTLGVDSQNLKQGAEGEVGNAKPHGDETFAAAGPKIWYLDPENRYYGNMMAKKTNNRQEGHYSTNFWESLIRASSCGVVLTVF